jgi:N-acyl-L-homoserine lactone synthetase
MSIAEAVFAGRDEFEVVVADTPSLIRQSFELRHQVYCVERRFLPGIAGLEFDEFDRHSKHVVLLSRQTGAVVGTVRLVLPNPERPERSFPMQLVTPPETLRGLPLGTMAEISRFAISKERRSSLAAPLLRLALMRGVVQASEGLTHWCAVMERSLLRLLATSAIHFHNVGPVVNYHGLRQPCFNDITELLDRVAEEQPEFWAYLTDCTPFYVPRAAVGARIAA